MASPFKTFEEFTGATGAIYSFAHQPAFGVVCLILVVGITIAFLVTSYKIKH